MQNVIFITLYGINGNAKWSGWTECQGAELSGAGLQCFQPGCAYHIQVDHWQLYVQVYWLEMVFFSDSNQALGDQPNANSGGKAAGHNTDGFDCSTTNLVIEDR